MHKSILLAVALLGTSVRIKADSVFFPAGYIPFSSVDYKTAPDFNGVSLVVGEAKTLAGISQLLTYLRSLPPITGNQKYAVEPIELGPGLFFDNVLVPTSAEREGNFEVFLSRIVDPLSGRAFAGNIIPMSRLGELFAFEIGPSAASIAAAPEPSSVDQLSIGFSAIVVLVVLKRIRALNNLRLG